MPRGDLSYQAWLVSADSICVAFPGRAYLRKAGRLGLDAYAFLGLDRLAWGFAVSCWKEDEYAEKHGVHDECEHDHLLIDGGNSLCMNQFHELALLGSSGKPCSSSTENIGDHLGRRVH